MGRRIEVPATRLKRWLAGFGDRHGESSLRLTEEGVVLEAPDGARAVLQVWSPRAVGEPGKARGQSPAPGGSDVPGAGGEPVPLVSPDDVARWARGPDVLGLVLVRRGGYAVGLAHGQEVTVHKVGTRYVQSRTAAGGWSQQRFARRRGNQADELVGAVADHAAGLLGAAAPGGLVLGGDRRLAAQVLADARLATLGDLPRRELFDLPDPRLAVLRDALARARSARVVLTEPV